MNPFGLESILERYKPGQLGAAPTLGNPGAQQEYQQADLAALMEAYKRAQTEQQRGDAMMTPEYVANSGGLGALAMIAQAYAGKKIASRADATATEKASAIFEEKQRQEAIAAQRAAEAEEAKLARQWGREDTRDAAKAEREMKLAQLRIDEANKRAGLSADARIRAAQIAASAQSGGASVLSADEAKALGLAPGTVAQRDRTGKISIVQPPQGGVAADPVMIRDAKASAEAAMDVLAKVGKLEEILKAGKSTGPLDQFIPGQSAQEFDAISKALNVSSLRANFGGNPTEGERAANLETLPSLGRYEDVNAKLIAQQRESAMRKIEAYNALPGVQKISLGGSDPAPAETAPVRATNPQTGEVVELRNGQWVKVN